jgi:hypothetical protein
MFERNEVVEEKVGQLWAACESLKEGDILTHEMIDPIINDERNGNHWLHCMNRLYKRLQAERGIVTMFEKTVGLRFLTADEAVTVYPIYRTKKGLSQTRRLRKSLQCLDVKKLNAFQRRRHLFLIEMAKNSARELRKTLRDQQAPIRPSPTLPRRKPIERQTAAEVRA